MYEVEIHNSIEDVKKTDWDSLNDNNVFMCYNWLKTIESTFTLPVKPYYIMIFEKKKLAAASVCYFEKRNYKYRSIDNILLRKLTKIILLRNVSFLPVLICGPKRGYGTHFIFSDEVRNQNGILQNKLFDAIENIADANNASICFHNVMEHEPDLIMELIRKGYHKTKCLPLNYIDIKWSSFMDYRKYVSARHPSMKKSIPRHINKNRKAGVEIKQLQSIDGDQLRLFELLKMNHNKYNPSKFSLKKNFFQHLKENFEKDAIIYTAEKNGDAIGVNVEIRKGKEAATLFIGIDHDLSQNDLTYFNITYYEPIKNAIGSRLRRLYCGNSLYETKIKRGYNVSETFLFYKPRRKSMNTIVKIWFVLHYWWMTKKLSYIKKL